MPPVNLLHFLLFSVLAVDHHHHALAQNNCHALACPGNNVTIRFPFRVGPEQGQSCGYPGFNLSCSGTTALHLPQAGEFYVRDINYLTQQIHLYDPHDCLPGRFLDGFHLSGSPFVANFLQNFTFIACPAQVTVSGFTPVTCLGNDTISVLATTYMSLARSVPESCKVITTLQVPVSGPAEYGEGFVGRLGDDLVLSWYEPYCRDCEIQGGSCGFFNVTDEEIDCFFNPSPGERQGLHVFRIIAMSIALPAILLTFAIACFACFTDRRRRRVRASVIEINNSAALPPEPMTGLDESTIESYAKVVLGESRRLPGPNDSTCSICLSEYCAEETLRCIPECKHCFHADCIDQWLRLNGTCPVCRKSPSAPSPSAVHAQAPS